MKKSLTPPPVLKTKSNVFKIIGAMLFCSVSGAAQNTFPSNGSVGIGTLTPQYSLDVNGSARVSGNLLVGGGIVTTQTLNASSKINAGDVAVTGSLTVGGSINASTLSTSTFGGIIANSDIKTQGAFLFNTPNNILQLGLKTFTSNNQVNTGPIIMMGEPAGVQYPPAPCSFPNPSPWLQMNGNFRSMVTNNQNQLNASLSMYAAPWSGDGHIECEGTAPQGGLTTNLYINYFCGRDILLGTGIGPGSPNTGKGGAKIFTGDYVEMRKHLQIGTQASPIFDANNTALEIFVGDGKGATVNTTNNNLKALNVVNGNSEKFVVYGSGATHIGGTNTQLGFNSPIIQDVSTMLNLNSQNSNGIKMTTANNNVKLISAVNTNSPLLVSVFTVKGNGQTQIGGEIYQNTNYMLTVNGKMGAREIKVTIQNPWPDFVF
jgi:hypothetical protein